MKLSSIIISGVDIATKIKEIPFLLNYCPVKYTSCIHDILAKLVTTVSHLKYAPQGLISMGC